MIWGGRRWGRGHSEGNNVWVLTSICVPSPALNPPEGRPSQPHPAWLFFHLFQSPWGAHAPSTLLRINQASLCHRSMAAATQSPRKGDPDVTSLFFSISFCVVCVCARAPSQDSSTTHLSCPHHGRRQVGGGGVHCAGSKQQRFEAC